MKPEESMRQYAKQAVQDMLGKSNLVELKDLGILSIFWRESILL